METKNKESRDRGEDSRETEKKKHNLLVEVAGCVVMVALGLYVYDATGLYSAADAGIVRVALGGGIAWWFISTFRHALHGK